MTPNLATSRYLKCNSGGPFSHRDMKANQGKIFSDAASEHENGKASLPLQEDLQVDIPPRSSKSTIAETPKTPTASPLISSPSTIEKNRPPTKPNATFQINDINNRESERQLAFCRYLGTPTQEYESRTRTLDKYKWKLIHQIQITVRELLQFYGQSSPTMKARLALNRKMRPKLNKALDSDAFLKLGMRLFGARSRDDIIDELSRLLCTLSSFCGQSSLLQSVIGCLKRGVLIYRKF